MVPGASNSGRINHTLELALATGICPKCDTDTGGEIDEQYSYGVYAGVMCRACAIHGYRDACGHREQGQGNPNDLDEQIDPEPYPGSEEENWG